MEQLKSLFLEGLGSIPIPGIMDIIDMAVVAYLFYFILNLIRSTSAFRIAKAIMIFLIATGVTSLLHMNVLNWLLRGVLEVGLIALVIMFQPELRRALDRLGGSSIRDMLAGKPNETEMANVIKETASACEWMSRERIGALIVFERSTPLSEYYKTGTVLEADLSDTLLRSIFFPKAALHDGAVFVANGRVAAASCVLPLTEKTHLSRDLGTRHRAGIGISEASDAVVVIVSEETGTISVAENGMLKRHLSGQTLARLLTNELAGDDAQQNGATVFDRGRQLLEKYWMKKDDKNAKK